MTTVWQKCRACPCKPGRRLGTTLSAEHGPGGVLSPQLPRFDAGTWRIVTDRWTDGIHDEICIGDKRSLLFSAEMPGTPDIEPRLKTVS